MDSMSLIHYADVMLAYQVVIRWKQRILLQQKYYLERVKNKFSSIK